MKADQEQYNKCVPNFQIDSKLSNEFSVNKEQYYILYSK